MAAQLNYEYSTPKSIPGAKADLSVDIVNARRNDEENGVMKFGMAVATGKTAGHSVKVPTATTDTIEGVVLHAENTEHDMAGDVIVKKNVTVDVMKLGHVWGRLATGVKPVYGAPAYVVCSGDDAGCFTATAADGTTQDIGATFGRDSDDGIAVIILK